MTRLFLVRHGESEYNRKELIQGHVDSELTEKGRREAVELREKLDVEFDLAYSSDLKRAKETAEILLEGSDSELKLREELRERNLGELHHESNRMWHEVETEDHHEWKPEGGESLKEHKERASEVLEEVRESGEEKILMVTHGGTIRAIIAEILNCKSRQVWRLRIDNCSLTVLESFREGWMIDRVNERV